MSHRSKLKRWGIGLLLYVSAVLVGLGSAFWVLKSAPWMNNSVTVGAWKSNMRAGSQTADLYTRASIALNALLALGRDETMYFVATHDDRGRTLKSACHYLVQGAPPKARWWSITAYGDDLYLFDAPNRHYSLNGSTAKLDSAGQFHLVTGSQEPDSSYGFWLPTPGKSGLVLTLRLYNPDAALQTSPTSLQPPTIQVLGACP